MKSRLRLCLAAASGMMAIGLFAITLLAPASSASVLLPTGTITDNVADTVTDELGNLISAPRADIVSSTVEYHPDGIVFSLRVREPVNPLGDTNWFSKFTYAAWDVDTTGDQEPDYELQLQADPDTGKLRGLVDKVGSKASDPWLCEGGAKFGPENSYTVAVDPRCFGNPASLFYRAALFYDTSRGDKNADQADDFAPDQGKEMAGPITKGSVPLAGQPATSSTTVPPTNSTAPSAQGIAPSPAPGPKPAPEPGRPAAPTSTTRPAPAPTRPAPAATRPSPTRPRPAPAHGPVAEAAATRPTPPVTAAPPPSLARTGANGTVRLAGLGAALLLTGFALTLVAGGFGPELVSVRMSANRRRRSR